MDTETVVKIIDQILTEKKSEITLPSSSDASDVHRGLSMEIESVAETSGAAYAAFAVFKHLWSGNPDGLKWDYLNLYALPKTGNLVSSGMISFAEKEGIPALKAAAPALGRAVGNIGAFYALAESIIQRKSLNDSLSLQLNDISIASNAGYIMVDSPAFVAETAGALGMEMSPATEAFGPVGAALSVIIVAGRDCC